MFCSEVKYAMVVLAMQHCVDIPQVFCFQHEMLFLIIFTYDVYQMLMQRYKLMSCFQKNMALASHTLQYSEIQSVVSKQYILSEWLQWRKIIL